MTNREAVCRAPLGQQATTLQTPSPFSLICRQTIAGSHSRDSIEGGWPGRVLRCAGTGCNAHAGEWVMFIASAESSNYRWLRPPRRICNHQHTHHRDRNPHPSVRRPSENARLSTLRDAGCVRVSRLSVPLSRFWPRPPAEY